MLENSITDLLEKQFGKLRRSSDGTHYIAVEQMLEKLSIHKTKLPLKLHEDIKVLGNSKSEHSCTKCGFLSIESICDVFENLSK